MAAPGVPATGDLRRELGNQVHDQSEDLLEAVQGTGREALADAFTAAKARHDTFWAVAAFVGSLCMGPRVWHRTGKADVACMAVGHLAYLQMLLPHCWEPALSWYHHHRQRYVLAHRIATAGVFGYAMARMHEEALGSAAGLSWLPRVAGVLWQPCIKAPHRRRRQRPGPHGRRSRCVS